MDFFCGYVTLCDLWLLLGAMISSHGLFCRIIEHFILTSISSILPWRNPDVVYLYEYGSFSGQQNDANLMRETMEYKSYVDFKILVGFLSVKLMKHWIFSLGYFLVLLIDDTEWMYACYESSESQDWETALESRKLINVIWTVQIFMIWIW